MELPLDLVAVFFWDSGCPTKRHKGWSVCVHRQMCLCVCADRCKCAEQMSLSVCVCVQTVVVLREKTDTNISVLTQR